MKRLGRVAMIVGVTVTWVPFAALTVLTLLAVASSPGLGESDRSPAVLGIVVAVVVPIAAWWALRSNAVAGPVVLAIIAAAIPLLWAPLMRSDYSAPLHWITTLATFGGVLTALGALLTILPVRGSRGGDESSVE